MFFFLSGPEVNPGHGKAPVLWTGALGRAKGRDGSKGPT